MTAAVPAMAGVLSLRRCQVGLAAQRHPGQPADPAVAAIGADDQPRGELGGLAPAGREPHERSLAHPEWRGPARCPERS